MNLKNLREIFALDDDYDIPIKRETPKPKYNYKVTEYAAKDIAKKKLTEIYLNSIDNNNITYLSLYIEIKDIVKRNNKEYYHLIATYGDISGFDKNTLWDGELNKNDLQDLQCLIDVNTKKFIYIGNKPIE